MTDDNLSYKNTWRYLSLFSKKFSSMFYSSSSVQCDYQPLLSVSKSSAHYCGQVVSAGDLHILKAD